MATIQQSIEVNVPVHAAYNQLTQFEEYPRFMEGVEEVRQLDDTHLHWHVKGCNQDMQWDAEITEQVPDRCIAWRNTSGPKNAGKVELQPTDSGKTKVTLHMDVDPQQLPEAGAQQENPLDAAAQRTEQDLARFKKFIESRGAETGEWRGEVHHGQAMQQAGAASSAAGSEGPDESAAPGVTASTSTEGAQARAPQIQAAQGEQPFPPQQENEMQSPASLSSAAAGVQDQAQPPVAEEQSVDQQSQQARRVGQMPDADSGPGQPTQAIARSLRREQPQSWLPNLLDAWEEPFVMMRRMTEELDQMLEQFVGRPISGAKARPGASMLAGTWSPPLEIAQRDNQLIVEAELPGIKREDVHVEIRNDRLIIEGDRRDETQGQQGYRRTERSYGHFYRMIALPEGIDPDAASASMRDGMLVITLPVPRGGRPGKSLDIRTPG